MRGHKMRFQYTAISLACITLLTACGGSGSGDSGNKEQTLDFVYPGARYLQDEPLPLVATATSQQAVSFTSETPSVCTIADGKVKAVKPGECSVTATVPGDSTYAPATAKQLFMVLKNAQNIWAKSPGYHHVNDPAPQLDVTSSEGLPVSIVSTSPAVCSLNGTEVKLITAGECMLSATQPGNDFVAAAKPVQFSFLVGDDNPPPPRVFLSGYMKTSAGPRTKEGGNVFGFGGNSLGGDNGWCYNVGACKDAAPSEDGNSVKFPYTINSPDKIDWAFYGIEIYAKGIVGFQREGDMTNGLYVANQKKLVFNLEQNSTWASSANNRIKIIMHLGRNIPRANGDPCYVSLKALNITPVPGRNEVLMSRFTDTSGDWQNGLDDTCGATDLNAATLLKFHPIVRLKFEADGTNTTVASPGTASSFLTEITLNGPITIE